MNNAIRKNNQLLRHQQKRVFFFFFSFADQFLGPKQPELLVNMFVRFYSTLVKKNEIVHFNLNLMITIF